MAKRKKKNRRVLRKLAVLVLAVAAAGITRWYQQQTAISLHGGAGRHRFGQAHRLADCQV